MGGIANITPLSIATDYQGNVYTTGYFSGQPDMDPDTGTYFLNGPSTFNSYSYQYLSKFDADGNFLWAKQFGSGNSYVYGFSVSADRFGNVITVGYYEGNIQYQGGLVLNSGPGVDAFILKLDSSGNFIWARNLVDMDAKKVKTDPYGNVFVRGIFTGTKDFDPGTGVFPLSATTNSFGTFSYLLKLTPSGNFVWATGLPCGSSGFDLDFKGNIFIAGAFTGTYDFDPGPGVVNLSSVSGSNANFAIIKLDDTGNFLWAKKVGAYWPMYAESIAIDPDGNLLLTGEFSGVVDFDPDSGVVNMSSLSGSYDIFILKLTQSGNFLWSRKIGGTSGDTGAFIDADLEGNVYTTGYFYNTVDFDPGAGVATLSTTAPNAVGVFLSKLDSAGNYKGAGKAEAANASAWPAFVVNGLCEVYLSGVYKNTLEFNVNGQIYPFSSGFNNYTRTFILKLKECQSSTQNIFLCPGQDFNVGNNFYNATGAYLDTLQNTVGNDSILVTLLTVYPDLINTITDTLCAGESINIGLHTYNTSGVYTDTLTASTGCDSLITTYLTVNNPIEVSTNVSGTVISSLQSNASYQWLDCNNGNLPISGATNQAFTPSANGTFAVVVNLNNCSDTSECVTITTIDIEESESFLFSLYPNPTNTILTVEIPLPSPNLSFNIYNVSGQRVYFRESIDSLNKIDISSFSEGLYFLIVMEKNTIVAEQKFIKE